MESVFYFILCQISKLYGAASVRANAKNGLVELWTWKQKINGQNKNSLDLRNILLKTPSTKKLGIKFKY